MHVNFALVIYSIHCYHQDIDETAMGHEKPLYKCAMASKVKLCTV